MIRFARVCGGRPVTALLLVAVTCTVGCGKGAAHPGVTETSGSAAGDPPTAPTATAPSPRGGGASAVSPEGHTPSSPATRTPTSSAKHSAIPPAHPVPAAFRPAPGAPSDAEVREQLAQLNAIQRRERERSLSAAAANLAGLLPWSLEPKSGIQVSVASDFRDYGLGLACGGLLGRDQLGVAHKTAPCGTLISFEYAGRTITVPVIDRGPYVAGREWDLTGATADALGFPGLGQVRWWLAG